MTRQISIIVTNIKHQGGTIPTRGSPGHFWIVEGWREETGSPVSIFLDQDEAKKLLTRYYDNAARQIQTVIDVPESTLSDPLE